MNKISDHFVHPKSKAPLLIDVRGGLCTQERPGEILFEKHGDSFDFVLCNETHEDRAYYDECYERLSTKGHTFRLKDFESQWHEEVAYEALLASMGDLIGKRILLVGNGMSLKELCFVTYGADVVYTDLSIMGVRRMKNVFSQCELAEQYQNTIEFHAVDALHLPFPDKSFDVIYGCAFVHHIQDLDTFFVEIARCLKVGGKCVFFDDAYSGIWNRAKNTILKPIQLYSHWKTGISPEDKIATRKGGFNELELELLMRKHSFQRMTFERISFFEYLIQRGAEKLGIGFLKILLPGARAIDRFLKKRTRFISKQGIRLVWGFER